MNIKKRLNPKNIKIKKLVILLVAVEIAAMVGILSITYVQQFITANMVKEQAADNAVRQAGSKLEDSYREIQNATKEISYNAFVSRFLTAEDSRERREYFTSVESLLSYTESMNPAINLIVISDRNGRMYTSNGFTQVGRRMVEDEGEALADIKGEHINGTVVYDSVQNRRLFSYSIPIYSVLPGTSMERIGVCTVILRADELAKALLSIDTENGGVLLYRDASGELIGSNPKNPKQTAEKVEYMEKTAVFEPYGWAVTSYGPKVGLTEPMKRVLTLWVLVCVSVAVLIGVIGAVIIRSITKPVTTIVSFISDHRWENDRLELKCSNEIGRLAQDINHMLDTITDANHELLEVNTKLYETELRQKQSELSALQSQINPHFLYNTLDCMRSIALVNDIREISVIAEGMSHIFRYSIKGDDIVAVKEEMECVNAYMGIMTTRFPDKITYEAEVSPQAAEIKIPKMILQPLVENAVYHGIEAKRGRGALSVKAALRENGILSFEVSDDGVGIDGEEVRRLNAELNDLTAAASFDLNKRIGLKNIIGRIRLLYGKKCGMRVSSEKFVKTTVELYMDVSGQL